MKQVITLEVWWDENDALAHDTGWKVLRDGLLFESSSRTDALIDALLI